MLGGNWGKFSVILVCVAFVKNAAGEMNVLYVMEEILASRCEVFCASCVCYSENHVFRNQ